MRKLGISLLIISISDNLIFNRRFVIIVKHLDLKRHKIIEVRKEQINEGRLQLYRILVRIYQANKQESP